MQSQDEQGKIVNTEMFASMADAKARMADVMEKAEEKGAVSHTIGHFPHRGLIVVIFGLKFEVKFTDEKHGEVRLKLVAP